MSTVQPIRLPDPAPGMSPVRPELKKFASSKPMPNAHTEDRDETFQDYFAEKQKQIQDDTMANDLLLLWVETIGGHFSEPSIRHTKKGQRDSLHELVTLQAQYPVRFAGLNIVANSRNWSSRLSMLAKAGLIRHTKKGYHPAKISDTAKATASATFEERMEALKLRNAALAEEIESYLTTARKFGSRCERRYFQNGSVDGLAPVTAARCVVNESHIISRKMISAFGLPKGPLSGAANMLLEECSVNQARAHGLVFTRVSEDGEHLFYNIPSPNRVSYQIRNLHNQEIILPRELRGVLLKAAILANHLEQFVHDANNTSPEKELYRAMTAEETGTVGDSSVILSEQQQEIPEISF